MEKPNREQRRREKFGRAGKVNQHDPLDPWPDSEANPALTSAVGDQAAMTGEPLKDDVTEATAKPVKKVAPAGPASSATNASAATKAPAQTKTAKE